MFNQPTDHLEPNKSLQETAVWEESAYEFKLHYLIGIFRWYASVHDHLSMLRLCRTRHRPFLGTDA
ncbi:hypothetical protein NTG1052_460004 [Candidatus Nitrotoga sp. 1052]|nr:hypothetical protein NTG1052_460004 [Candidatus Nitrotoga sp. 1052]